MLRLIVALVLLAMLAAGTAQAQNCSQTDIRLAATAVAAARTTLNANPIGDFETDIPTAAQSAIVTMKTRLAELAVAYMRCASADIAATKIRTDLSVLGHAADADNPRRFAETVGFTVDRGKLITISGRFNIPCAIDDVTGVFAYQNGGWREAMRLQSGRYKTVGGATDGLTVRISPPDAAGHWFAVTKSVVPWCSSTWSAIDYSVVRPGRDATAPATLLRASDPIYWGDEDFGRLRVGTNDFELRFHAQSIDIGVHNREWVRRFSVAGNRVTRIAPYANTPRDFVEEWIQSDWKTVAPLTAPSVSQAFHDKLHKTSVFDYVSVRRCKNPAQTQIEVEDDSLSPARNIYFTVKGPDFRMLAVRGTADPMCKGHNQYGDQL